MDNKGFSDEAKKKNRGTSKYFNKYLTNAEFSFPLAKSPQCTVLLCTTTSNESDNSRSASNCLDCPSERLLKHGI